MIRVSNRKAVRRLALKSFHACRLRNLFVIVAVILTTVLFTSLFTAAVGINYSFEQQNMREVGGYSHGTFKYLSEDQEKQLSKHPLLKEYGVNLLLSGLYEGTFAKHTAEIRYFSKNGAKMFFSDPTTGRLPNSKYELATDTEVLKLLGVKAKLGEKITLTYPLGSKMVTDTFTLCGYWETDPLMKSSQVMLSKEYVKEQLKDYKPMYEGDNTGSWDLDCMFKSSSHIEANLRTIAKDNGYQIDDGKKEHYLATGVNWAYTSTQAEHDNSMLYGVAAIAAIIILSGYLIIYNIFFISVANDIRYYGLLKTIGTTGRQIRQMLFHQVLILIVCGIPFGLLIGYFLGEQMIPVIMNTMSCTAAYHITEPGIFIGAALFSAITVILGILKPSRAAAKVSPVEAVRYTESASYKKSRKRSRSGAKIYRMAFSNLWKNKKKTVIVLISLSLSIVLLNSVYVFTTGFDINKYTSQFVKADFTVAGTNYFNVMNGFRDKEDALPEDIIDRLKEQEGFTGGGKIYYDLKAVLTDFTKKMADYFYAGVSGDPDDYLYHLEGENSRQGNIQLYGMEDYILNKLEVIEGTLDLNKLKSGNYIIQIVGTDDYGKPVEGLPYYHPGDTVKLHYVEDRKTSDSSKMKYHSKSYKVMAVVKEAYGLSARYYINSAMILPADHFLTDTGTSTIMSYLMDAKDSSEAAIEQYLKDYTSAHTDISYESKELYRREFYQFRDMFLVVGSGLSMIVGMIGILNFINVILTSIITRRREFSILKSIGMTGKQLNTMLILEGLIYASFTIVISGILSIVLNRTVIQALGNSFWFFRAHNTVLPVLVIAPVLIGLSLAAPFLSYRATNRQSIVEQLRALE